MSVVLSLRELPHWGSSYCCTSSAVANLAPTLVTFTLALWPGLPAFTKITNPWILAIPSPCLLISVICTSYSLPVSTGFGPKLPPPQRPAPPSTPFPYCHIHLNLCHSH